MKNKRNNSNKADALDGKFLFLCYTPLHALIAKSIIETCNPKSPFVLYITSESSQKHERYFSMAKLSANGNGSYIYYKNSIELFRKINKFSNNNSFEMIFSGNIKKAISRYLIYKIGAGRICTFDDGLGNIVGKGYFYEKKENFFSFLFFMIFQRDMLYANIRNKINTHYTIYDARNAYHEMAENIVRINLLGNSFLSLKCKKTEKKPQEIVIYLGTVFDVKSSVGKRAKSNIDNFVLKFFNVDFYLPHPRESTKLIHSKLIKNTVHCPIIAEEFVANKALSGYSLTLIMSNSSAGVNIKSLNIPGVSVLNVYHPTFQPNTSRLMEDFDIKSLRIDPKDS